MNYAALSINVNSTRKASSSSLRSSAVRVFLYSVLMNRLTCDLDTFRKFSEIEFDKSGVVPLPPRGMGHSGHPAGGARWQNSGVLRLGSSHPGTFSHVDL